MVTVTKLFRPPKFLKGRFFHILTFSGLAKVAIFTTIVDAENQTLINHKCVCGALNRHFCQTRVSTSFYLSVISFSTISFVIILLFCLNWSIYNQVNFFVDFQTFLIGWSLLVAVSLPSFIVEPFCVSL